MKLRTKHILSKHVVFTKHVEDMSETRFMAFF